MARRSVFDDMIRRSEKAGNRHAKAVRKSLGVKKKKKSGKKRAKRNERDIRELAGQISVLSQQIADMKK
ncbi:MULTISPECIES: hypothetical protein [unclassified Actinomadura]|uniref:hypothetical protein n=1 Tax=unclassified Actinomadura TaxID=2626254 RepID=UPI0011ED6AE2|nr:hypothetical protein [Actinomadura sp. K4S16]